jgi:hypothetical protein
MSWSFVFIDIPASFLRIGEATCPRLQPSEGVKEIDQFVPSIFNVSCAFDPFSAENLAAQAPWSAAA